MQGLGRVCAAVVAALALGALTGCEVKKQFAAECTTSPPVPHQNFGQVEVDVEVPPKLYPDESFTVRVDHMVGYPNFDPGSYPTGVISVSGPVTPSGDFSVGQGIFGGAPYPNELEFTVTGEPGEQVVLGAERGSSVFGTVPDGYVATCFTGGAVIVALDIVEPDQPA